MSYPSLIKSATGCHCPKCRRGNLFQAPAYRLRSFSKMNERCTICGQTFMPEPSFYMGAMFVSYALQMGLFLLSYFGVRSVYAQASLELYMAVMIGLVLLTLPWVYRLSRSIWIHLMVKYQHHLTPVDHESSSL